MPNIDGITLGGVTYDIFATELSEPAAIDGLEFNGQSGVTRYAVCSTAAETAAKEASLTDFVMDTGATVRVKFANANTATNPTLNVNALGAYPILLYSGTNAASPWEAGEIVTLTFDGTNWMVVGAGQKQVAEAQTDSTEALQVAYGAYPTDTASGAIASFTDGANGIPVADLVANITAVQSGSGDPSPDNVRPISGWTGMTLKRTGQNLFDPQALLDAGFVLEDGYYTAQGNTTLGYGTTTKFKAATRYRMAYRSYVASSSLSGYRWRMVYTDGTARDATAYTSTTEGVASITADPGKTVSTISRTYGSGGSTRVYIRNMMLTEGTSAVAYVPFTGDSASFDWTSEAGTVYGGTLDVTTGILTVTHAMVDIGSLTWSYSTSPAVPRFTTTDLVGLIQAPATTSDTADLVSSMYSVVPYTTLNSGSATDGTMASAPSGNTFVINLAYSDAATFRSAMSGVPLIYPLATPVTYQLTPQEITTAQGINNIWADTGDVTVTYRADPTLYIGKKIAEVQALILES